MSEFEWPINVIICNPEHVRMKKEVLIVYRGQRKSSHDIMRSLETCSSSCKLFPCKPIENLLALVLSEQKQHPCPITHGTQKKLSQFTTMSPFSTKRKAIISGMMFEESWEYYPTQVGLILSTQHILMRPNERNI